MTLMTSERGLMTNVRAEIHDTQFRRIAVNGEYRDRDLIKSVPGASWSKRADGWTVPLSWSACLALRGIFGDRLEIGKRLDEWARNYQENVVAPPLALREALDAPGDDDLYSFQRAGVKFLASLDSALLADDPGSGKTVQAIRALKLREERGETVFPALIVAPNSVKFSWKREFEKFWPMKPELAVGGGPSISVVDGSAVARRKALEPGFDVYIINWEMLRSHSRLSARGSIALRRCFECGGEDTTVSVARCHAHEKELNQIDFVTVIADEIHRAKDPASQQARALLAASESESTKYRIALTGTPVANSPSDMWSIFHWLRPHEWSTKVKWIDRYVNYSLNPWGGMSIYGLRNDTKDEFFKSTDYMIRRMPKSITLPFLPPVVHERRDAPMVPKQKKAYDEMEKHLMTRLEDGSLLSAPNPMTQTLRLVQFASASGEIITNEAGDEKLVLTEPSGKIDTFMDDILAGDFDGQSVVVFAQSKQLIDLLGARMAEKELTYCRITGDEDAVTRQSAIDMFQDGKRQFILCTLGAGSTGITLTKASVMVFLQRSWSAVEMTQAENRAHRIGSEQHESILRVDYVTPGTVEESVLRVLDQKEGYLEEVVRSKDLINRFIKGEL